MRKIVAWPLALLLYWIGEGISHIMYTDKWPVLANLYPVYNTCMNWSAELSFWADLGLWQRNH